MGWGGLDYIVLLCNAKRRSLQDFLGGTLMGKRARPAIPITGEAEAPAGH